MPACKLWPGGFVNVRMLVQHREGRRDGADRGDPGAGPQGPYVFVIKKPTTTPSGAAVKLGHEDDIVEHRREAVSRPASKVVTDGAQRVTDGGKVAVAGPDGNAPDAVPARERGAPGTGQRPHARTAEQFMRRRAPC